MSTNMSFVNGTSSSLNDIEIGQCSLSDPVTWHPSFTNQAADISSIVVVALQFLTIPFVIFFNAVTLIIIAKFEALQKERFVVLALLAVTDLLSGLISQPLLIAKELYHLLNSDVHCNLDGAFYVSVVHVSGMSSFQLVFLTYERYVAITDPYGYLNRITIRRLVYVTVANWLIHTVINVIYLIDTSQTENVLFVIFFIQIICIFCIIYWYVKIFAVIRKQKLQELAQQHNAQRESNHKSVITAVLLLGSFFFSSLPMFIAMPLQFYFGASIRGPVFFAFHPWALFLVQLNALYNPIIYGIRLKEFRRHFFLLFGIQIELENVRNALRPRPFIVQPSMKDASHEQQEVEITGEPHIKQNVETEQGVVLLHVLPCKSSANQEESM